MLETARGRWFLTEYARRNQPSATEAGLAAIQRMEAAMQGEYASLDRFRSDLEDMAQAVARAKAAIAAIKPDVEQPGQIEHAAGKAIELLDFLRSRLNAMIDLSVAAKPPADASIEDIGRSMMTLRPLMAAQAGENGPVKEETVPRSEAKAAIEDQDPAGFLLEPATAGAASPSLPAQTPSDPLAPLRALSDEEKIALFS
jgi:hypothetical protein